MEDHHDNDIATKTFAANRFGFLKHDYFWEVYFADDISWNGKFEPKFIGVIFINKKNTKKQLLDFAENNITLPEIKDIFREL